MIKIIESGLTNKSNEPIRFCPSGFGYKDDLMYAETRMCRNSGYKDPIYTENAYRKAV